MADWMYRVKEEEEEEEEEEEDSLPFGIRLLSRRMCAAAATTQRMRVTILKALSHACRISRLRKWKSVEEAR
jgi:TPP-dependent pyruvate/acetoin dehydrogenase alpha subunit